MLKKRKIYFILIIIAVAFAAVFFYINHKPDDPVIMMNDNKKIKESFIFPAPDQTQYQMQLYLDVSSRTLYGNTVLVTKNTTTKTLDELWFTSYPNCFKNSSNTPAPSEAYYAGFDEGWLTFSDFKINGLKAKISQQGVCIKANPAAPIRSGENIRIEMNWQEKIPRLKYRYGNKDAVYMLGNFYPALNVLSQDGWHNSYNSLFGDPFCFHSANYSVSLSIPENYQTVSTGAIISRQTDDDGRVNYFIQAQNARDFCLLVMYDYTEIEQKMNGVTVKCYYPGNNMEASQKTLAQAVKILNYYSCQFGSYPYSEFKVVFVPMQGFHGMEYSGLIYLTEEFLQKDYNIDKSQFILAHEIAHQWWYGMVGNDQLKEPWLDEGLANWSAYKYLADIEGKPLPAQTEYKTGIDLGKELREMYSRQEYYLTAYSGGEAFWFGLEKELGDQTVIKVLRRYLADYKNKIATTSDLMDIIKIEAHQNMDEYISQWFPTGTK